MMEKTKKTREINKTKLSKKLILLAKNQDANDVKSLIKELNPVLEVTELMLSLASYYLINNYEKDMSDIKLVLPLVNIKNKFESEYFPQGHDGYHVIKHINNPFSGLNKLNLDLLNYCVSIIDLSFDNNRLLNIALRSKSYKAIRILLKNKGVRKHKRININPGHIKYTSRMIKIIIKLLDKRYTFRFPECYDDTVVQECYDGDYEYFNESCYGLGSLKDLKETNLDLFKRIEKITNKTPNSNFKINSFQKEFHKYCDKEVLFVHDMEKTWWFPIFLLLKEDTISVDEIRNIFSNIKIINFVSDEEWDKNKHKKDLFTNPWWKFICNQMEYCDWKDVISKLNLAVDNSRPEDRGPSGF